MPAPKGNKFNLKNPIDRHSVRFHVPCKKIEFKNWKKAAGTKKLAAWAREKLNKDL